MPERKHQTREITAALLQAGVKVGLEGEPGSGKSSFAKALAEATGHNFVHLVLSNKPPTEIGGLDFMKQEGDTVFLDHYPPSFLRMIMESEKAGVPTLLVIDEATDCPRSIQSAVQSFLSEGRIGRHQLPSTTKIMLCYNPPDVATNGHEFGVPFSNRFVHLKWRIDPVQWIEDANRNFNWKPVVLPDSWREKVPKYRDFVLGFLMRSPNWLSVMPKDGQEPIYPTPRTWYDMVIPIMAVAEELGWDKDTTCAAIGGAVGPAAALEFYSYMESLDLPDPNVVLRDPEKFNFKKIRPDVLYVLLNSCTTIALAGLDRKEYDKWKACITFVSRAAKEEYFDIAYNVARRIADDYNERLSSRKKLPEEPMRELVQAFGNYLVAINAS